MRGGNDRIDLNADPFDRKLQLHVCDGPDFRREFIPAPREESKKLDILEGFPLRVNNFLSAMIVVLGMRGCGKTNTIARIAEQLLKLIVPMTIIDVEGEYWSLKEMFPWIRIIGNTRKSDEEIPFEEQDVRRFADEIARDAIYKQQALIIDVSQTDDAPMAVFLGEYFKRMYEISDDLFHKGDQAVHVIFMEEAHNFIPLRTVWSYNNEKARIFGELMKEAKIIATQGRKRGLGVILATQRNQEISRTVTSQADIHILHRVTEPNDMKVFADIIGEPFAWLKTKMPQLEPGEVLYKDKNIKDFFKVQMRESFHPARTPNFSDVEKWQEKMAAHAQLQELRPGKQEKLDEFGR